MKPLCWSLIAVLALSALSFAVDLQLAAGGKSSYQIVKPENPSVVDDYAIGRLAKWLKVSLKFDVPSYGGKASEDEVLCERIILVEKGRRG